MALQALSLSFLLLVPFVYKVVSKIIAKKLRASITALDDIPLLSNVRSDKGKIPGTAVICGGSIAGLLAARVCSSHFAEVIIVESEEWVATGDGLKCIHERDKAAGDHPPPKRSHIAQYYALHFCHPFIGLALARLFPNAEREFAREGATVTPVETNVFFSGVPMLPPTAIYPSGVLPKSVNATRPVLETTLRRMVIADCPNIKYQAGNVTGLLRSEGSNNQLVGVRARSRGGDEQRISASLVIDCTGPACGGLRWLKDLPLVPNGPSRSAAPDSLPLQDLRLTYDHKMAYTTCEFLVPSTLNDSLHKLGFPTDLATAGHLYLYYPNPKVERTHLLIQGRENNSLQFACGGWDMPRVRIANISDIRIFLSEMTPVQPLPDWIFATLNLFEQEEVPANYYYCRCPPSVYIQYHRAKNLPQNFIALGDSVLQSNPVAGEGLTKACVEAVTLNGILSRCVPTSSSGSEVKLPADFGRKFFAAQAKRTGHVWDSLKTTDYSFKTTVPASGDNLETTNALNRWYVASIMHLSTKDKHVAAVLYQSIHWLAPGTDLFAPAIVLKVLWLKFRKYMGV